MFEVIAYKSVHKFLSVVEPTLLTREAENSLMLGLCYSLLNSSQQSSALLLAIFKNTEIHSAAIQTPPYNLIVSRSEEEGLGKLADYLSIQNLKVPGVVGPNIEATIFAEQYSTKMNCKFELGMDQRIYEARVINVPKVSGSLKLAESTDFDKVSEWLFNFSTESLPQREKFDVSFANEWAKKAIADQTAYNVIVISVIVH